MATKKQALKGDAAHSNLWIRFRDQDIPVIARAAELETQKTGVYVSRSQFMTSAVLAAAKKTVAEAKRKG